jgi:uncharacterized protein YndB with AHSA1/START domain
MLTTEKKAVTVSTKMNAPIEKVWSMWTDPKHIVNWNNASDDWYTPKAENDLKVGGRFNIRMESRDGTNGFDFSGEYDTVILLKQIKYTLDDGRTVQVSFTSEGNETSVNETFEAESENSLEMQRDGWQAILENFKKYVEKSGRFEVMHFEILIDASVEKVYNTMIDEKYYSEWTSAFNSSSRFKGSWAKGSKILFLGESQDGSTGGMVSRINENIPNRFISIEHLGIVQNDKEVLCGPEVETWAGALENYSFRDLEGRTQVSVDIDCVPKYRSYFIETWPKALQILKTICESENVRGKSYQF